MAVVLVTLLLVVFLLTLWLPTLITLLKRRSNFQQIIGFLFFEVLIAVSLLAILDLIGASNPAGYLFSCAIVVSIGSFLYAYTKRFK
ncbi:MAG: hypothetical protein EOO52_18830 [Gammaproteobacteria bacterium]|nr:MAG: hypothetical protein EOO52_18830 [Gammaproteobacteria bacterium]